MKRRGIQSSSRAGVILLDAWLDIDSIRLPIDSDSCTVGERRALRLMGRVEEFVVGHFDQPNPLMQRRQLPYLVEIGICPPVAHLWRVAM